MTYNILNYSNLDDQLGNTPWNPSYDLTMTSWYDAADTDTIIHIANKTTDLYDKSSFGYHLDQNNDVRRPVTNTMTLNDLNILDFNEGNLKGTNSGDPQMLGDVTWVWVVKPQENGLGIVQ